MQLYREVSNLNEYDSPVFDMIRISDLFGLYDEICGMFNGTRVYSKFQWKELVWKRAWDVENQDWSIRTSLFSSTKIINRVSDNGRLLIWWQLAGIAPELMRQCEVMAKIVCKASCLKIDCYQFRRDPTGELTVSFVMIFQ